MAETPTHAAQTLEELKKKLAATMGEARRLLVVINGVEDAFGLPHTTLAEFVGSAAPGPANGESYEGASGTSPRVSLADVHHDTYLGESPLEAAKKYIDRVGRAVPLEEIAEAVSRGGAAVRGADWKGQLEKSLLRSTLDVVKVQEGVFGLRKFYTEEQVKRLRSARRREPAAPKRGRRRGRAKRSGKPLEHSARPAKPEKPAEQPTVVRTPTRPSSPPSANGSGEAHPKSAQKVEKEHELKP